MRLCLPTAIVFTLRGITAGGFYLHPSASIVQISETERGLRILSDQGVPAGGAVLLSLPLDEIIFADRGRDGTPAGRAIARSVASLPAPPRGDGSDGAVDDDGTYLALWLCHALHGRGTAAPSAPDDDAADGGRYLDLLPVDLAHLPVFWSESDLVHLQGSVVASGARAKRIRWAAVYDQIVADFFPRLVEETSREDFCYACALVETRGFRIRTSQHEDAEERGMDRPYGLVPFADLCNHRSRSDLRTCDWSFEEETRSFVIRTGGSRLQKGEEVCLSYGLYANSKYLGSYGFALEDNRRHDGASPDVAHVHLFGDDSHGASARDGGYSALAIGDREAAEALLSALRLSVATATEGRAMVSHAREAASGRTHVHGGERGPPPAATSVCSLPFSPRNERASMTALRRSVVAAIGRYETTLEEDEGLLYGEGKLLAFSRRRNAVLVRAGEKHVLRHWKTLCDAALTFLDDVAIEKMDWEGYCKVLDATLGRVVSIAL